MSGEQKFLAGSLLWSCYQLLMMLWDRIEHRRKLAQDAERRLRS